MKCGINATKISVLLLDNARTKAATVDDSARLYQGAAQDAGAIARMAADDGFAALSQGLTGISVPAVGLFLAAGPMLTTLRTVGAAAAAGDIAGGLVGYGVPEQQAENYERMLQNGATLIAAHCGTEAQTRSAALAFAGSGATDIVSCIQVPFGPATTADIPAVVAHP